MVPKKTDLQVTVDVVIFALRDWELQVLLIQRRLPPFEGGWALPGGFVRDGESLDAAARRELEEETGVRDVYLEQLYTFGDPDRDPRGRVVTVAYYALLTGDAVPLAAGTDAGAAMWMPARKHPPLAFDHEGILDYALQRLSNKLEYTTVGFKLLPKKFTLGQLQRVYETVLGRKLDKRNFRRKMSLLGILKPLDEWIQDGPSRPAQLHRFSAKQFEQLRDKGILFPF
jgi:ADP-ribose pyrophosphatase YjhB (NUDIX family)